MMTSQDKSFDIVVVGNVGVDTSVYYAGDGENPDLETGFTRNLDNIGQSGGYSSRGFAQLGYRTGFIGAIGDDYLGDQIKKALRGDGIDLRGTFIDPKGTNRSVNLMRRDGGRKSYYDGRGNHELQPDLALCTSILNKTGFAHFSIPNWARQVLPIAQEQGVTISCDLQDIVELADPYRQDFIHYADILFFSNVNHPSPAPLMEEILDQYPDKILVSGMGSEGCALGTKDGIDFFPPYAMDQNVLDTNGAGDSLAVGFISGYCLEKKGLEESIWWGQIAARHACTLQADSSRLITRELLEDHLSQMNLD